LAETRAQALAAFIGDIEPKSVRNISTLDEDGGVLGQRAVHPTGQDENAREIAGGDRRQRGLQRDARALQRDAIRFTRATALIGDRPADGHVESTLAEYSPDADRHAEVTLSPHIEKNRRLAIREQIEPRDDALVAIPVDRPLGREPMRAILPAGARRAVRR